MGWDGMGWDGHKINSIFSDFAVFVCISKVSVVLLVCQMLGALTLYTQSFEKKRCKRKKKGEKENSMRPYISAYIHNAIGKRSPLISIQYRAKM